MPVKPKPTVERFWPKVDIAPDDSCWEWLGAKNTNGYGKIWDPPRFIAAHRFSYELANGPIPTGLLLRHTCDNPRCVNPAHLITGTTQQNIQDKINRNRGNNGIKHGRAVLTNEAILEIKSSKLTGRALAKQFNVSPSCISKIRNGKAWQHISEDD